VLVPGGMSAAIPFDFCVNSIVEADGPAGGTTPTGGSGANSAGTGSGSAGTSAMGTAGTTAPPPPSGGSGSTLPPLQGGCNGYATRYWDCCKPHCGWSGNTNGATPLTTCDRSDNPTGADAQNACEGGQAYLCHSMAPWSASSTLAYGFAAVAAAAGSDICGRCYQLQFTGTSHNAGNDPGAAALAGKTLIVQAINIGGDVGGGQFDLAIPGGGVGAFNACSTQWGVSSGQLGMTYGGFLATCKQQTNDHAALKSCVMQSCMNVFEAKGLTELDAGCKWYVDWFELADNPALKYAEVACPSEIMNKGMRRSTNPSNACLR
jgi:hypothetical protein